MDYNLPEDNNNQGSSPLYSSSPTEEHVTPEGSTTGWGGYSSEELDAGVPTQPWVDYGYEHASPTQEGNTSGWGGYSQDELGGDIPGYQQDHSGIPDYQQDLQMPWETPATWNSLPQGFTPPQQYWANVDDTAQNQLAAQQGLIWLNPYWGGGYNVGATPHGMMVGADDNSGNAVPLEGYENYGVESWR